MNRWREHSDNRLNGMQEVEKRLQWMVTGHRVMRDRRIDGGRRSGEGSEKAESWNAVEG